MRQLTAFEWSRAALKRGLRADTYGEGIPFAGLSEMLCLAPTLLKEVLDEMGIEIDEEAGIVRAVWCWEV